MCTCISLHLHADGGWGYKTRYLFSALLAWAFQRMDKARNAMLAFYVEVMNWGYGCYHGYLFLFLISFEKSSPKSNTYYILSVFQCIE